VRPAIFLNYYLNEEKLARSVGMSGERTSDIYVNTDAFGRNCFGGGGLNTHKVRWSQYTIHYSLTKLKLHLNHRLSQLDLCLWRGFKKLNNTLPPQAEFSTGIMVKT
jgi:hypothetical protein